ncbi:MAG: hypothetical protein Q7T01_00390 [bacterium]|nr:hypothetical protein [bacterium]
MLDRKRFARAYALRLASRMTTVLPVGIGAGALVIGGFILGEPMAAFLGILGILGGIGMFCTRLVAKDEALVAAVAADLQEAAAADARAALDALARELAAFDDPQPAELLRELRELLAAFARNDVWATRINDVSAAEITSGVRELGAQAIEQLRATLQLSRTMQDLPRSACGPLTTARTQLIGEVRASVGALTTMLAEVVHLGSSNDAVGDVATVRQQLQQSLDIARRVDAAMQGESETVRRARQRGQQLRSSEGRRE